MEATRVFLMAIRVLCIVQVVFSIVTPVCDAHQWTEPVPLTEVNSKYDDKSPFLSFDGLTLYFSVEPGWGYTHTHTHLSGGASDSHRPLCRDPGDQHSELHAGTRGLSVGVAGQPAHVLLQNGNRWQTSESSAAIFGERLLDGGSNISELNRLGDLANPTLTQDERIIVFSGNTLPGGKGQWDLWMASRSDQESTFADIQNLELLNSSASDMHPYITPDGLTLYFGSNRNEAFQLFRTTRTSLDSPFGPPEHLSMFDTPGGNSYYARLSADGKTFFFCRQEPNAKMDIHVSYASDLDRNQVELVRSADSNGGRSVVLACATIQEAIDAAQDGDAVNVSPGVYRGTIDFAAKAITVCSVGDAAVLEVPDGYAVSFHRGEGADSVLRNFVIRGSRVGILIADSSPTIVNVTVVGNECGIEAFGDGSPDIRSSIFWDNTWSDLYGCQATYSCIERGAEGQGNFSENPMFADPDTGDYHLRSTCGRYWPEHEIWVLDDMTSPCVDAGDPDADFSGERQPNGGRVNAGAFGGTAFASMSQTPASADFNTDGVVDANDLVLFMDRWEQQVQE